MNNAKEHFLLSKMNVLQLVTAHLAVIISMAARSQGVDLLGSLHQSLRESLRTKLVVTDGDTKETDALELQTTMLKHLDEFFAQVRAYADTPTQK